MQAAEGGGEVGESRELGKPRRQAAKRVVAAERDFFIDNLLVRNHFTIVMIRWTGLAPWEFEFPFPGSLTSTVLAPGGDRMPASFTCGDDFSKFR